MYGQNAKCVLDLVELPIIENFCDDAEAFAEHIQNCMTKFENSFKRVMPSIR